MSLAVRRGSFAVLAQFRNEVSGGLREWCLHYIAQGAEQIALLDNASEDNWRSALEGLESHVAVFAANARHCQTMHYRQLGAPWLAARGIELLLVADIDEYLFADTGTTTRGATLAHIVSRTFGLDPGLSQVTCTGFGFGSSGLAAQPASLREGFTWRMSNVTRATGIGGMKSIVRLPHVKMLHIHTHEVLGRTEECPIGVEFFHYQVQSRAYFNRVKMARGDAQDPGGVTRNNEYFQSRDWHDERDTRLARIAAGEHSRHQLHSLSTLREESAL